jgi:shikimate dehydrogenase
MSNVGNSQEITGSTEFVGVIGDPVSHSLSPRLHNCAYRTLGLDIRYGAFRVPVGATQAAILGARALGFRGLSVTTPHKDNAARYCDQRSEEVAALGAANTIVFLSGVAVAMSTDGEGLLDDLRLNCDFPVDGRNCVVLGAGGAARAIVLAFAQAGAREVVVVNRNEQRALEAVALAGACGRIGELREIGAADLVVNATSMGLVVQSPAAKESESRPGDRHGSGEEQDSSHDGGAALARFVQSGQLAVDLSYRPARTPFLHVAAENGAAVRNGLGMLVHQAAAQVRIFSGHDAPISAMWESVGEFPSS